MNAQRRGFFGVGIFHPKYECNAGGMFRSAAAFGASFVFTVGRRYKRQASDTMHATGSVPCYHYLSVDELKAHLPLGCRLVGVELADGARPLADYVHPHAACYLLGAEDHGLTPATLAACHEIVVISGASQCLNVASAGTVVLYDRINKKPSARRDG